MRGKSGISGEDGIIKGKVGGEGVDPAMPGNGEGR